MNPQPEITKRIVLILETMLDDPAEPMTALDICAAAGLPFGSIHADLARLEQAGWVHGERRQPDLSRPARRFFQLSEDRAFEVADAVRDAGGMVPNPMPGEARASVDVWRAHSAEIGCRRAERRIAARRATRVRRFWILFVVGGAAWAVGGLVHTWWAVALGMVGVLLVFGAIESHGGRCAEREVVSRWREALDRPMSVDTGDIGGPPFE